ncbi:MAG: sodium:proton exchanger, partial [Actinomycetota bacterium]|nr:sodium:proton exchanger [Actinomycetota bacterium]
MTIDVLLACSGVLAIAVAALSGRLRRLPVSEPVLGLLAGVLLGPAVLGVLPVPSAVEEPGWLHEATRILLAISVMSVALRY